MENSVEAATAGKSIVLFSDGTGNGSAKLFKTNVWRMYEATDLGPSPKTGDRLQVGYYDNGIGSQTFKPLAILTGIFGIGLRRNVLSLYRYACRNHSRTNADDIFAFGFSRGAFTMRIVIALIASQGLVDYEDERDLLRKSSQAYREMRRSALPRSMVMALIYRGMRWVQDKIDAGWQKLFHIQPYRMCERFQPTIKYVGLWDTVAAYGGPIAELTRAIDNWIFPLSMPNYHLAREVKSARHALSIDDERDSFHPLLWDEVHEAKQIANTAFLPDDAPGKYHKGRIQQVWFTGMHADVGGGYPDESLSYVSLSWIMEGAVDAGLRMLADPVKRIEDMKNAYGPIHNSRAGAGSYYRYQPRRIAAWLHPVDPATYILRDPAVVFADGPNKGKQKGLLLECKVHESVIARINSGTDDYAPITLPERFEIIPPPPKQGVNTVPMVDPAVRARLTDPDIAHARGERQATLFDQVWKRRVLYFSTLFFTALLIASPILPGLKHLQLGWPVLRWAGLTIGSLQHVLPGLARPWIDAWSTYPTTTLALVAIIGVLWRTTTRVELKLRDSTRALWWGTLGPNPHHLPGRPTSALRRFRESRAYQRGLQVLKWNVLPNVIGVAIWIFAAIAALSVTSQTNIALIDNVDAFCPAPASTPKVLLKPGTIKFLTSNACGRTTIALVEKHRYALTFDVTEDWQDVGPDADGSGIPATPMGLTTRMPLMADLVGSGWQRSIEARWFQPVAVIRNPAGQGEIFPQVAVIPLKIVAQPVAAGHKPSYRAEFEAPIGGRFELFVNDAVPPTGDGSAFYRHNRGKANVTIVDLSAPAPNAAH